MSLRWIAAVAALGFVIAASAGEKKKLDFAPETGPQPREVPSCCDGITPPSTHHLEHPPQCPKEPAPFVFLNELTYQLPVCPAARSADRQMLRTYSVADLVIPMPTAGAKPTDKLATQERDLIRKICASVEPKCWAAAGGQNSIDYYPLGMALVVNAPPTIHEAVEKYLDGLRQIQDTQFSIQVVVATVSDAGLEKIGLARDFKPTKAGEVRTRVKFLSAEEVAALTPLRGECESITAPTITVLNGQEGCVQAGQVEHFLTGVNVRVMDNGSIVFEPKNEPYHLGIEARLCAGLSADGRFVKMAVRARSSDVTVRPVGLIPLTVPIKPVFENGAQGPVAPFTQFLQDPRIVTRKVDETVTLPDGGTAVFYGGPATTEETVRDVPPMFADVPFLQELFARDKKVTGTNHLLVFATPHVVKATACDDCVQCAGGNGKLVKLMTEYTRACREGNVDEARRLAMECLVVDPTCFGKK